MIAPAVLWMAAGGALAAQSLADLKAAATPAGEAVAIVNDYVRVRYAALEYPPAERRVAEARPVVLYVSVESAPGGVHTQLLDLPRGSGPVWRPGVVPRGVHIEVLNPPPSPPALGYPGTDLPRDATVEREWEGGRLVLATFEPSAYGSGTGRFPSVTTFLSDGSVEVSNRGVRRRTGVRAGDAFWFEAATRLTVVSDSPVGVAIVQVYPGRQGGEPSMRQPSLHGADSSLDRPDAEHGSSLSTCPPARGDPGGGRRPDDARHGAADHVPRRRYFT